MSWQLPNSSRTQPFGQMMPWGRSPKNSAGQYFGGYGGYQPKHYDNGLVGANDPSGIGYEPYYGVGHMPPNPTMMDSNSSLGTNLPNNNRQQWQDSNGSLGMNLDNNSLASPLPDQTYNAPQANQGYGEMQFPTAVNSIGVKPQQQQQQPQSGQHRVTTWRTRQPDNNAMPFFDNPQNGYTGRRVW